MIIPSKFDYRTVALADIHSEKAPFRITTNSAVDDLTAAFNRVGLINSPLLLSQGGGYVVVCGYRRVLAARALSWESIPARILPAPNDPLECACLSISENSIERSLNLIETSRALSLLESIVTDTKERYRIAGNLGLPSSSSLIKKIAPLCHLPQFMQNSILSGEIALPSVLMLSKLPSEIANSLSELLIRLKLSLSKQKELIVIIQEISVIEDCAIGDVIQSEEIQEILVHSEMDLPRKAGLIRDLLKRRRYPHLSMAQDSFEKLKRNLSLGENASLKPPPGFESNRYNISFSFSDMSALLKHRETIGRLAENKDFKALFESSLDRKTE